MTNPINDDVRAPYRAKQPVTHGGFPIDSTDVDLLTRPSFSFRFKLILGFLLLFILCTAITIGALTALNRIEERIHFLLESERYLFEIEQARRWEKNYFLYGTNLEDALQSIASAMSLLSHYHEHHDMFPFPEQMETMRQHLDTYRNLLDDLVTLGKKGIEDVEKKANIEVSLRKHGFEMVKTAASLALKQEESINTMVHLLMRIPIYAFLVILLLALYIAHFLSQGFMKRLNRITDITHRIAKGNFSPIQPKRKYRDEFTTVEIAINRMTQELLAHQNAMMASHKLKAIGTLTAGVAHELNNPLNNIMLTAHALLEDHQELREDELVEMVNDLIAETERSQSIVRNLLDFTRQSQSVFEPIDLGALVDNTVKLALNQAKVAGVKIELKVHPNLPKIRGDRQQLKQAFLNLILNALDAVKKNDEISITVDKSPTPGFLAVRIKDNGSGIPAHVLPHIFDPFFTTKGPGKGTGLGLPVTHGIVANHEGRIDVASQEGKYTMFTVSLPVDRSSQDL